MRAIEAARAAAAADDVGALRTAMGELSARTYEMTERLYAELGGKKEKRSGGLAIAHVDEAGVAA